MKPLITAFLTSLLLMVIAGCSQPLEMSARDAIAANSGLIRAAQDKYTAQCKVDSSPAACQAIKKDVAAQNVAIDLLEGYCGSKAFNEGTGLCEPHAALKDKLTAAILDLNRDMADVKATIK